MMDGWPKEAQRKLLPRLRCLPSVKRLPTPYTASETSAELPMSNVTPRYDNTLLQTKANPPPGSLQVGIGGAQEPAAHRLNSSPIPHSTCFWCSKGLDSRGPCEDVGCSV